MPDLSLTSEQEILRSAAREFVERECPLATVRAIDESPDGFSRELWERIAALGWTGVLVPPGQGGEGASLTDAAVLYEELGRGLLPGPHHSSCVIAALLLQAAGNDARRERLLPAIARGEKIVALAYTEADYGWSGDDVQMTATARNGGFVLDGLKRFVPDAGYADELIVAARTKDGLTLFLVPADAVSCQRTTGFVGEPQFDVTFDGVRVTPDAVLGEPGGGWAALEPVLDIATALLCAYVAGAARRVYETSLDYAQQRVQFGQPIARFQRVQDRIIDIVNHADAARWTAFEAIWKLENDKPGAQEAVSVAKSVASDGFYQLCELAHHVHGGVGSDKSYGLYLYTKKSRSFYHYLGDPAYHRRRIARRLEF